MRVPEISELRVEYETAGIAPESMADDPMDEFTSWLSAAVAAGVEESNAFVLATASPEGTPSARAVLLKAVESTGLVFYSNRQSRKGREMSDNPRAAGCFVWLQLHRQIRVEGAVEEVDAAIADAYFASRPLGSRLAAAASPQSRVVSARADLEARFRELEAEHPDGDVRRPADWVGYRILPEVFEFWQGRPHRFHDRVRYRPSDGGWVKERLAP